jgi:hypothetical protein
MNNYYFLILMIQNHIKLSFDLMMVNSLVGLKHYFFLKFSRQDYAKLLVSWLQNEQVSKVSGFGPRFV